MDGMCTPLDLITVILQIIPLKAIYDTYLYLKMPIQNNLGLALPKVTENRGQHTKHKKHFIAKIIACKGSLIC